MKLARWSNLAMLGMMATLLLGRIFVPLREIAIVLNDGGILAAAGIWDPPTGSKGPLMSPVVFVVGTAILCLATLSFLSDAWRSLARKDNCFYYITAWGAIVGCLATFGCVMTRYLAWHNTL